MSNDRLSRALRRTTATVAVSGAALAAAAAVTPGAALAATPSFGERVVQFASTLRGDPYVYGAAGPRAFDCSGLTQYVFAHFGVRLPRTAAEQYAAVRHIPRDQARPGDILFLSSGGYVYHDGIYAGNGRWWVARHTGTAITLQQLWTSDYLVGRVSGRHAATHRHSAHHRPAFALRLGMHDEHVLVLQRALHLRPTGRFGWSTRAAVVRFQARHGLHATGVVDGHTWRAIVG